MATRNVYHLHPTPASMIQLVPVQGRYWHSSQAKYDRNLSITGTCDNEPPDNIGLPHEWHTLDKECKGVLSIGV